MDIPIRPYKIEIQITNGDESGAIKACRFERFHGKMRIERETGLLF